MHCLRLGQVQGERWHCKLRSLHEQAGEQSVHLVGADDTELKHLPLVCIVFVFFVCWLFLSSSVQAVQRRIPQERGSVQRLPHRPVLDCARADELPAVHERSRGHVLSGAGHDAADQQHVSLVSQSVVWGQGNRLADILSCAGSATRAL